MSFATGFVQSNILLQTQILLISIASDASLLPTFFFLLIVENNIRICPELFQGWQLILQGLVTQNNLTLSANFLLNDRDTQWLFLVK